MPSGTGRRIVRAARHTSGAGCRTRRRVGPARHAGRPGRGTGGTGQIGRSTRRGGRTTRRGVRRTGVPGRPTGERRQTAGIHTRGGPARDAGPRAAHTRSRPRTTIGIEPRSTRHTADIHTRGGRAGGVGPRTTHTRSRPRTTIGIEPRSTAGIHTRGGRAGGVGPRGARRAGRTRRGRSRAEQPGSGGAGRPVRPRPPRPGREAGARRAARPVQRPGPGPLDRSGPRARRRARHRRRERARRVRQRHRSGDAPVDDLRDHRHARLGLRHPPGDQRRPGPDGRVGRRRVRPGAAGAQRLAGGGHAGLRAVERRSATRRPGRGRLLRPYRPGPGLAARVVELRARRRALQPRPVGGPAGVRARRAGGVPRDVVVLGSELYRGADPAAGVPAAGSRRPLRDPPPDLALQPVRAGVRVVVSRHHRRRGAVGVRAHGTGPASVTAGSTPASSRGPAGPSARGCAGG